MRETSVILPTDVGVSRSAHNISDMKILASE